jgi:hypothetical protein
MTDGTFNLGDVPAIPDLSGIEGTDTSTPWSDGWYKGTILEQRSFTDSNGNDRVFSSSDEPSQRGDSRNLKLQVVIKRTSDNRELNISYMLNYRPEDLTQETVQAVIAETERVKTSGDTRNDFRAFISLQNLGKLQKVAGVRQLQRNGNGGLNLVPLFGKSAYFRIGPDDRKPEYKMIKDLRDTAPKNLL